MALPFGVMVDFIEAQWQVTFLLDKATPEVGGPIHAIHPSIRTEARSLDRLTLRGGREGNSREK
jgi:hypothetical protein